MNNQSSVGPNSQQTPKFKLAINIAFIIFIVVALTTTVVSLTSSDGFKRGYKPVQVAPSVTAMQAKAATKQTELPKAVVVDLQPMATKLSENNNVDTNSILSVAPSPESSVIYTEFWESFDYQANLHADFNRNGSLEPLELQKFKESFLSNLGYMIDPLNGMVYVRGTTVVVSPETLACYFNGMVPGRGYIKPNCPPN